MDDIRHSEWLLLMATLMHLIMAPFTKVEESFNTQALHDILFHGRDVAASYDHLDFPGVVPRTFVGPLALASVLYPLMPLYHWLQWEKYWMLFIGRFILGFAVLLSLANFCRSVERHFRSRAMGTTLRLLIATQFHFLFYASRPLPNTFALVLVLLTYQRLLDAHYTAATVLATVATFLFRFELVLLYGPIYLLLFVSRRLSIVKTVGVGILTLLAVLLITVPLDSYFWQQWPLWPEGRVILFNLWENRSGEYGRLPLTWYFTSALPRALATAVLLAPLGFLYRADKERRLLLATTVAPALCFIAIYSLLPHKELRFILYTIPLLNLPAASFISRVWEPSTNIEEKMEKKDGREDNNGEMAENEDPSSLGMRLVKVVLMGGVIASLLANILSTTVFLYASARNYPGGDALSHLQFMHRFLRDDPISVHIDVFSAENGVNRFLHLYPRWEYNKTENLTVEELARFDYLLIGGHSAKDLQKQLHYGENEAGHGKGGHLFTTHKEHFAVEAFHRVAWKKRTVSVPLLLGKRKWKLRLPYPTIEFKKKVVVMKKRDFQ